MSGVSPHRRYQPPAPERQSALIPDGEPRQTSTRRAPRAPYRTGELARTAILRSLDDLLKEYPIADISVRAISQRAGITRSAFYFYFETKYAALASLLSLHSGVDLETAFAPRRTDEPRAAFIDRIVTGIRTTLANDHPVWASSRSAAAADRHLATTLHAIETTVVRAVVVAVSHETRHGAQPISDDLPRLVHTLLRATLVGCTGWRFDDEPTMQERSTAIAKALWQQALWAGREAGAQTA